MEWKSVESSQIAEVGFDGATSTLGIRFKPTKKQQEAGLPGGEYHYAGVDYDTYYALMTAESVGKFFGEHVKPFTEKFPFTKITPQAV